MPKVSPFARGGFSPNIDMYDPFLTDRLRNDQTNNLVVFSGGDLQAYINNIRVGNLEQITYTTTVEVAGNYTMGSRNVRTFTTGKRVIVGSLVFSQYDRHAILEGVFGLSKLGIRNQGDLWNPELNSGINNVGNALRRENAQIITSNGGVRATYESIYEPASNATTLQRDYSSQLRGISQAAFNQELAAQLRDTARIVASQRIRYTDQIPQFDLTITGVDKAGNAARMAIFGLQITQESGGWSQNELGNSVGVSYMAQAIDPWKAIEMDGELASIWSV